MPPTEASDHREDDGRNGQAAVYAGLVLDVGDRGRRVWWRPARALGLSSPLGGFGVLGAMSVAIVASHLHKGFWNRNGGVEFSLMIALPALALTLIGPGAVSLDNLFNIALPEPASWIVLAIGTLLTVAAALRSRTLATPAASDSVGAI